MTPCLKPGACAAILGQQYWEYLICAIVRWADDRYRNWRTELGNEAPLYIPFDTEAQHFLHVFEEKILAERFRLDDEGTFQFSNFIPKAMTHLVSTAGMLHIITAIDSGVEIDQAGPIRKETVVGAAKIILFHLGQAVEFFSEVFSGQKERSDLSRDLSRNQDILRRTLLIKAGDQSDLCDLFFLEEEKDRVKEKGYITIKEIGDRYRNKTNNINISNKSIGKYLKSLGINITRTNNTKGLISFSDYSSFLEKKVTKVTLVTEDINTKRLLILNEWKDFLKKGHPTVTYGHRTSMHPSDSAAG